MTGTTCLFPSCLVAGRCLGHAPSYDNKDYLAEIKGGSFPGAGVCIAQDTMVLLAQVEYERIPFRGMTHAPLVE